MLAFAFVGSAGILFLTLLAAPDGKNVDEAVRTVFERGGYQSELPGYRPDETAVDPSELESALRRQLERPETIARRNAIGAAVLWILGIAFAAIALFWLYHVWSERHAAALASRGKRAAVTAPAAGPGPAPVPDAERLAGEGLYGEAVHAVLIAVLARFGPRVRPAWTAREAARAIGRRELAGLVELVEVILFGGRPATREDYERALALQRACVAGGDA